MLLIIVGSALLLDLILGEPRKYHPLVGFGNLATSFEKWLNPLPYKQRKSSIFKGGIAIFILVLPFMITSYFLVTAIPWWWLAWIINITVLYWAIGHQSLREHSLNVFGKLNDNDINASRKLLSMIVSRNTDQLDETQITQATIETVLENGSDAIFAPIFWFCLLEAIANLGAPAVILYRLVNTLDAMWGYRNERFLYFGRVAARLDDVLNCIPARLVAISYAVLGNTRLAFHCWKQQSPLLKSPNAGPVMTAGAGSLNIRLGGPAYYHEIYTEKPYFGSEITPQLGDIKRSLNLVRNTLYLWCFIIALISIFVSF